MIKTITADELKDKMDQGEALILVDCREQAEWDAGHIPGAQFIPLSQFAELSTHLDKSAQIIMQCRSGQRSLKACYFLEQEGYTDLTNLEGGILGWANHGFDISVQED